MWYWDKCRTDCNIPPCFECLEKEYLTQPHNPLNTLTAPHNPHRPPQPPQPPTTPHNPTVLQPYIENYIYNYSDNYIGNYLDNYIANYIDNYIDNDIDKYIGNYIDNDIENYIGMLPKDIHISMQIWSLLYTCHQGCKQKSELVFHKTLTNLFQLKCIVSFVCVYFHRGLNGVLNWKWL